jgi:nicotinate-nucleotide adenylyltransferase
MATLCFGGSFNPIHHGHLICARAVAERAGYDRVLLIPSANPPHKPDVAHLADAHHRLLMTEASVRGTPLFHVSPLEVTRKEPSYTLITAQLLKQQGFGAVHWLIGADMAQYLPHWHQPERLMREVHFVVMARPGWSMDGAALPEPFRVLRDRVVEAPRIELSATQIRRRVAEGRPIDFLTPPAVVEYIREHKLYRSR